MDRADVARAFVEGRKASSGNYYTDGQGFYLFGNQIAYKSSSGRIHFTDAGYVTVTTQAGINAILRAMNSDVYYSRKHGEGSLIHGGKRVPLSEAGSEFSVRARKGFHGKVAKRKGIIHQDGIKMPKLDLRLKL